MSAATVVLFIFVSHGPTSRPPDGVVAACVRALPEGARPVVRTAPGVPPDDAVVSDAAAAGAVAAVVVTWDEPKLLDAQVRVATGLPGQARWSSRRVSFDPADQLVERERALGLVIASIVDDGLDTGASARAAPPAAAVRPAAPPPPAAEVSRAAERPEPAARAAGAVPPWALEASVITAFEEGNDLDDTIGGAVGLRRMLPRDLALRFGLTLRLTERDDLHVRTQAIVGALGLSWTARRYASPGVLGFGLRADLLASREAVRYADDGAGGADEQSFWSLGTDLLAEAGIGLSPETALVLGVGGEMMFSAADLWVGQRLAATLPRGRLILQFGILARF